MAMGRKRAVKVVAVSAEDHDLVVGLVDLDTVAVKLDLVQPVVTNGHSLGRDWAAGLDEAGAGHGMMVGARSGAHNATRLNTGHVLNRERREPGVETFP
jgi:hypothetical protein